MYECGYFTRSGHLPNCTYCTCPHHIPNMRSQDMYEQLENPRELPSYMKFQPWVDPLATPHLSGNESAFCNKYINEHTKTPLILEMPNKSFQRNTLRSSSSSNLRSMSDEHSTYMAAVEPRDAVVMLQSVRNSHKLLTPVPSFNLSTNSKRSDIETELRKKKIPGLLSPSESVRYMDRSLKSRRISAVKKMLQFLNTISCDEFDA